MKNYRIEQPSNKKPIEDMPYPFESFEVDWFLKSSAHEFLNRWRHVLPTTFNFLNEQIDKEGTSKMIDDIGAEEYLFYCQFVDGSRIFKIKNSQNLVLQSQGKEICVIGLDYISDDFNSSILILSLQLSRPIKQNQILPAPDSIKLRIELPIPPDQISPALKSIPNLKIESHEVTSSGLWTYTLSSYNVSDFYYLGMLVISFVAIDQAKS